MSYLRKRTTVSWEQLQVQFGSQADTRQARHKFRMDFDRQLKYVVTVYRGANVEVVPTGVILRPSSTHIAGRASRELPARS
jgi:hypothetical protein